jgi:hypothetical protein
VNRRGQSILAALVWFAIIVVIALGAAGLVSGLDHRSAARSELTAPGDAAVGPLLDAAETDLAALTTQVEGLGTQARGALAALNGGDPTTAEAAIAEGDRLVADIERRTAELRGDLQAVPHIGTVDAALRVSEPTVIRHAVLVAALDATAGLDAAWARLSVGSVAAIRMSQLLSEHDRLVLAATEQGRLAKYPAAMKLIDQASAQLTDARTLRDQLAATVDVTVLDEWVKRNAAYDVALRKLYEAISKVGSKVTAATRAAVKAEADARARLPPDTRGLVIIMADIGRGGMNGAVITIEEARAKLADALEPPSAAGDDEPEASDGP